MNPTFNGTGTNSLLRQVNKKSTAASTTTATSVAKETHVIFQTVDGVKLHGVPIRVTRYAVMFELYDSGAAIRLSEALEEFKIIMQGRTIYSGRVIVQNVMDAGTKLVCEARLKEASWADLNLELVLKRGEGLTRGFKYFLNEWQKIYQILPEFKIAVADLQVFLYDLRLWLEQVELGLRTAATGGQSGLEQELAAEIGELTTPALSKLFEKFENTLRKVEPEFQPVHQTFGRHQLHPILLCSPFLSRCFSKPLGYAGDYEMVNMMMRNPLEGGSLFAKIVNLWFLKQSPAQAHRNRIEHLGQLIVDQTARAAIQGRTARIMSIGCGPAHEVQQFLRENHLANHAGFTLIDFNEETLAHCQKELEGIKNNYHRTTSIRCVKKSVQLIVKEAANNVERVPAGQFDLVYCAGLFDYLSDPVCRKLTGIGYDWLAPGGRLLTTNVDQFNPRRITMDYIMDWHLLYRTGANLLALKPENAPTDMCAVTSDSTGVNIYFEAQKPQRE